MYAYATYPGLYIEHADMVLSHGVRPSVCSVVAYPGKRIEPVGTLEFRQSDGTRMRFRNCAVDYSYSTTETPRRAQRLRVKILDRRWKWQYAKVDGEYNRTAPDGLVDAATEATYEVLIGKLLTAMGETNYSITLPEYSLTPPYVRWAGAYAASELSRILERIGCRVWIGLDDRTYVAPVATGYDVRTQGTETLKQFQSTRGSIPEKITMVFGDTRYQSWVQLEAVGMDTNGDVKILNRLSYRPTHGWEYEWPHTFPNLTNSQRMLAFESVYRWYRITKMGDGTLNLPGRVMVSSISNIFPVSNKLITTHDNNGDDQEDDAYHAGTWYRGDVKGDNFAAMTRVDVPFEVDGDTGLIRFAEPVYRLSNNLVKPAVLYLMTSYGAANTYYEYSETTGVRNGGEAIIRNRSLHRTIVQNYSATTPLSKLRLTDNRASLQSFATQQIDAYRHNYQGRAQASMQWGVLEPVNPNGKIAHVRWTVGYGAAKTYAVANTEMVEHAPTIPQLTRADRVDRTCDDGVIE